MFFSFAQCEGVWLEPQRVYRIYRELGLHLRIRPRHRMQRAKPDELAVPERPNQMWSGDFTMDQTSAVARSACFA